MAHLEPCVTWREKKEKGKGKLKRNYSGIKQKNLVDKKEKKRKKIKKRKKRKKEKKGEKRVEGGEERK